MFSVISDKIKGLEKNTGIEPEYFKDLKNLSLELPKIIQAEKDLLTQGQTLRIGIIGQVKAGKSSFLNSLLFQGRDLLPKASTPMTAGLTVIGYGESPKFKVEYYSKEDWDIVESQARQFDAIYHEAKNSGQFEDEKCIEEATKERAGDLLCSSKELVERCNLAAQNCIGKEPLEVSLDSIDELHGRLHQFVGANGEFTSVTKTLYLYLPEEGLKGIEIVDTPGVNDPIVSREERTNEFLRSCHGVFLLSYTGQFCSNTDLAFLKERVYEQGINAVVVLGSKFDSGLIDIARTTDGDLEYAVNYLSNSLKEGLKEAFEKKNLRKELPKIDCTSGLCHALYNKPENQWDENEAHIAKLLIKNYPDFGANKEYFKFLGNIEGIKEKYVDGDFKINKERIIADRYDDFTQKHKSKILKTISDTKSDLTAYYKKVESLNSNVIENQKNQSINVEKLGKASLKIIDHTINDMNNLDKSFLNKRNLENFDYQSYLIPKEFKIEHYSGYWVIPNTRDTHSIDVVDSVKLKDNLSRYLKKNLDDFYNEWNIHFSRKGPVASSLRKEITNLLQQDGFNEIDPEILQEVLMDSFKNMARCAEGFSKEDIEEVCQGRIDRIKAPSRKWGGYYKDNTMDPKSHIDGENEQEQLNYREYVNQVIKDYKLALKNEILRQKGAIGEEIIKMKEIFETEISTKFDEVTKKYEIALEEKEMKLMALARGIQEITEIQEILTTNYGKQRIETATEVLG